MYKAGDTEDMCDPRRSAQWDKAQRDQQAVDIPAGMSSRDEFMDTWYNHFVTLHGWGVKKTSEGDAVPYWVVENSWGEIYSNDPTLHNNGAGPNFGEGRKNSFVLIADAVAGRGGLEFINRKLFSAAPPE